MVDLNSEARYIKNELNKQKEREIEKKNIYIADKKTYIKILDDINNPQKKFVTEDNIPILFKSRYIIYNFMKINNIINLDKDDKELFDIEYDIYIILLSIVNELNGSEKQINIPEEYSSICDNFLQYVEDVDLSSEEEILQQLSNKKYNHLFTNDTTEE